MRGETKSQVKIGSPATFQSAPLMRGETAANGWAHLRIVISIHSPLTRGDRSISSRFSACSLFQSAPLSRGETQQQHPRRDRQPISIHSPHTRGDPRPQTGNNFLTDFNPLPSHEGRHGAQNGGTAAGHFNPLPSHEGRLPLVVGSGAYFVISIHSPHTRGDNFLNLIVTGFSDFNPLPSHEGRRKSAVRRACRPSRFQSTPLTRGETPAETCIQTDRAISIHSPHTRGDRWRLRHNTRSTYFNPLPSHEGRPGLTTAAQFTTISIHSPHTRGDASGPKRSVIASHFNPLPSHEGRPCQTP